MQDRNRLIDEFLEAFAMTASRKSAADYERLMRKFAAWCKSNNVDPITATPQEITAFITPANRNRPLSSATIRTYLSILSSFFQYLEIERGMTVSNPAQTILRRRKPKASEPGPAITRADAQRLPEIYDEAWTRKPDGFEDMKERDLAVMRLIAGCGLRRTEVANLNVEDLNFEDGAVRVIGKGGKLRAVAMNHVVAEAMENYLKNVRPHFTQSPAGPLFLEGKGRSERIRPDTLTYRIGKVLRQFGRLHGRGLGPHTLRRSFGAWLLADTGGNIRAVQETLGHSSISTTQRYTKLSNEETAAIVRDSFKTPRF